MGTIIIYGALMLMQVGVIVYFVRLRKKDVTPPPAATEPEISGYEALRSQAVNITPQMLQLSVPDTQLLVYGIILDWHMGEAIVTLAAYITGAANMYFSTGESVTGGGRSRAVSESAAALVIASREYRERMVAVSAAGLPAKGCVRFLLLTSQGKFGAQENARFLQDSTSPWFMLFEMGRKVMSEIQAMQEGNLVDDIVLS